MKNPLKIGDKLKCLKNENNFFGQPLFIENEVYEILDINGIYITLDHILYANEYGDFDIDFVLENFEIL